MRPLNPFLSTLTLAEIVSPGEIVNFRGSEKVPVSEPPLILLVTWRSSFGLLSGLMLFNLPTSRIIFLPRNVAVAVTIRKSFLGKAASESA